MRIKTDAPQRPRINDPINSRKGSHDKFDIDKAAPLFFILRVILILVGPRFVTIKNYLTFWKQVGISNELKSYPGGPP